MARLHSDVPTSETGRTDIDELLADLTAQIDSIRRVFDSASTATQTPAVVFIDDLAHCMECSWAKLEAAGIHLTPDVVSQCGRLLEASLHVLQQIERLQTDDSHPPACT
jgi:hypothetical protein